MTHPTDDPLRVALEWYADQFCELGSSHECCGRMSDDECSGCRARAALAAAPQPAPAPADERAAMIEVMWSKAAILRKDAAVAADALFAAGWTRSGDAAGLREALEAILNDAHETEDGNPYWREVGADALDKARAALARPSAPETLAWAVVGEDGPMVGINYDRMTAQHLCNPGERVVRVAIRVVEDGGEK